MPRSRGNILQNARKTPRGARLNAAKKKPNIDISLLVTTTVMCAIRDSRHSSGLASRHYLPLCSFCAGQLFQSMEASLPYLQDRATEKEGAFVVRIVLQHRHRENKPFEISKRQYCFQLEMPTRTA